MDLAKWLRLQVDRVAAVGFLIAGVLVLVAGWIGVSSHAYPAEQLPYIASAGLGGLFLLGVGAGLWLSADLLDEWNKLDRLECELREQTALLRRDVMGASREAGAGMAREEAPAGALHGSGA